MIGFTWLGNGLTAIIIIILVFFRRVRNGFYLLLTWAVSGILVQLLKNLVFPGHLRPVKYLGEMGMYLRTIPGIHLYSYHSFPSGHTATAFAIWFGLAFICRSLPLKITLFILAVLVGYSRIYLGQHFPEDVLGGAVLGGLAVMIFTRYVNNWKKDWLDRPLISFFRKSSR